MSVYLDHAATTPLRPEVLDAMQPYLVEHFGNPSSIHGVGRRARLGLDEARETVARILGAKPREIVFTGGGTEADNLAVKGAAWAASARGRELVVSGVEHKAVTHAAAVMERFGFGLTWLLVDRFGRVDPADVEAAVGGHTTLVSVMYANNEVGTIQPIAEIGAICRSRGVLLHVDAIQAAGYLPLDVDALGADLVSLRGTSSTARRALARCSCGRGPRCWPSCPAVRRSGSAGRGRRTCPESWASRGPWSSPRPNGQRKPSVWRPSGTSWWRS